MERKNVKLYEGKDVTICETKMIFVSFHNIYFDAKFSLCREEISICLIEYLNSIQACCVYIYLMMSTEKGSFKNAEYTVGNKMNAKGQQM